MINDQKYLLKLIKILEYVPKNWNIAAISKKNIHDLSSFEWGLLNRVVKEKRLAQEIDYYLSINRFSDIIMKETMKIDLKELIDEKFGLDQVQEVCDKYLDEYETYEDSIKAIEKKERTAFDEAVLYILECNRMIVPVNKLPKIYYLF